MKTRIYLRVAKVNNRRGYKVDASTTPNYEPLKTANYRSVEFHPTVSFAVDFDIPDGLFKRAEEVIGEINVGMAGAQVNAEVLVPDILKLIKSKVKTKGD